MGPRNDSNNIKFKLTRSVCLSASSTAYTAKKSRTGQMCRWRSDWWIPFEFLEPSLVPLVVLRQLYVEELQHGNMTETAHTLPKEADKATELSRPVLGYIFRVNILQEVQHGNIT